MIYREFGLTGIKLSVIGLGGHEYLPDGKSRGFNEDRQAAVRPGYKGKNYGNKKRLAILSEALERGINLFDVTIDPEKEALGRNLREIKPSTEIYIQTRPEGMGYGYDPFNKKMADLDLLRKEVQRIIRLLKRDCIDILNIPFVKAALENDPEYPEKIRFNASSLQNEGLIRFTSCDTAGDESFYLTQINSGIFDSMAINFNFTRHWAAEKIIPAACKTQMGIITREVFLKGQLFKLGKKAGIDDKDILARISTKWNLSINGITSVLIGADTVNHLQNILLIPDNLQLNPQEEKILRKIRNS